MASLQMSLKICFTRKAASTSSTYIVVFDNKKTFLIFLQGMDYPQLGSAYLCCACAFKDIVAHASMVNLKCTMDTARADNERITFTSTLPVLVISLRKAGA